MSLYCVKPVEQPVGCISLGHWLGMSNCCLMPVHSAGRTSTPHGRGGEGPRRRHQPCRQDQHPTWAWRGGAQAQTSAMQGCAAWQAMALQPRARWAAKAPGLACPGPAVGSRKPGRSFRRSGRRWLGNSLGCSGAKATRGGRLTALQRTGRDNCESRRAEGHCTRRRQRCQRLV